MEQLLQTTSSIKNINHRNDMDFFTIYKIRFSSKADEGKAISGSIKTKRHLNTAHRTQILLEKAGPGKGSLRYDIGCRDLSQIMFRNVCKYSRVHILRHFLPCG